jgi:hypothetical protein
MAPERAATLQISVIYAFSSRTAVDKGRRSSPTGPAAGFALRAAAPKEVRLKPDTTYKKRGTKDSAPLCLGVS